MKGGRAASLILLCAFANVAVAAEADRAMPYTPVASMEEAIERIEQLGGSVRRVSKDDESVELDLRFVTAAFKDEHLQYALNLKQLVSLQVTDAPITDAGVDHIAKLADLKRLYLGRTAVTDAGVKRLASLKNLE